MQVLKEDGQTEAEMRAHRLVYLHINYNTFRLAFWIAYHYINNEIARQDVRKELMDLLRERTAAGSDTVQLTVKDIDSLPILGKHYMTFKPAFIR